ncbi:hypothetical protein ACJX0J_027549, partial [Zea mays]
RIDNVTLNLSMGTEILAINFATRDELLLELVCQLTHLDVIITIVPVVKGTIHLLILIRYTVVPLIDSDKKERHTLFIIGKNDINPTGQATFQYQNPHINQCDILDQLVRV